MPKKVEMVGKVFGRLTVIEEAGIAENGHVLWRCKCICGKVANVQGKHLRSNNTKSCGCLNNKNSRVHKVIIHGRSGSSEYTSWCQIKARCTNPNRKNYKNYGGRGIKVCDAWVDSFENFYRDMGPKPSKLHSIERKNNEGNYEPDNCRWATVKEQSKNRRTNRWIEYKGKKKILQDWADELGVSTNKLSYNLTKKTFEEVYNDLKKLK